MNRLINYLNKLCYDYKVWHSDDSTVITVNVDNEPKESIFEGSYTVYDNIKDLRKATGLTQQGFADYFGISIRNIQDWEANAHSCKSYLIELMEYKLRNEGVIK